METITFFPGAARRITLGPPALLVAGNKTRRIRIPITMPLSGESFIGLPTWLDECFVAVSKFATNAEPQIDQIPDVTFVLTRPTDEAGGALFESEDGKVPNAELKRFVVERMGDAEEPDVVLKFTAYASYSRDLWRFVGEMGGEELKMHFASTKRGVVETAKPDQPKLIPEEIPDAEAEAFAGDSNPEEGPGSAEFEQQVRQSIGAPEPLSEAPRLMRHDDPEPGFRNGKDQAAHNAQKTEQESTKKRRRNLAAVN